MEVTLFTLISIGQGFTRFFVANLVMLRCFFCRECRIYTLFCRECRDYALFGIEFWQKFLEILRILEEILRKKLATGASGWNRN